MDGMDGWRHSIRLAGVRTRIVRVTDRPRLRPRHIFTILHTSGCLRASPAVCQSAEGKRRRDSAVAESMHCDCGQDEKKIKENE